jgi:hypothetical protein
MGWKSHISGHSGSFIRAHVPEILLQVHPEEATTYEKVFTPANRGTGGIQRR